jgi:drug/metabolite transporter (DMT)-like permease
MTNTESFKEKAPETSVIREVEFVIIHRRVKLIGMAIIWGIIIAYFLALFVSGENVNPDMAIYNLLSLLACFALCVSSFYIKKILLKQVNKKNFTEKYFSSYIITFALCDAGGLLCVLTNLVMNQNIIFATTGLLISILYILINFPRKDDLKTLNLR